MTPTKPVCFLIYEMREVSHMVSEAPSCPDSCQICLSSKAGRGRTKPPGIVSWCSELPGAGTRIHQLPEVRGRLVQLRQFQLEGRKPLLPLSLCLSL